ncbi:hypothetical protein [uncultured Faecalibaculum sp.]|uniref:hypothetical protein n=1 Tax=uncultured Faecalibaculum sp. TaxID=1729681 RepID=UPI0025FCD095|nr:hypothetical protein [uncultured Faecalibaculum sp.]
MRKNRTAEISRQFGAIACLSLVLGTAGSLIALCWGLRAFCGVWCGVFMCLAGLSMIQSWACRNTFTKMSGFKNYAGRYIFYGLVIAACLWLQVPVLSLMAGIALQKAALVIYPLLGKEDVDGPRCNKRH